MQFKKTILAASMAAACVTAAYAEEKKMMPEKPGVPTLGQIMEATGISINGYIDTSYTYLSGSGTFTSGTANRVFDTERRGFNLHMLDLTISALPPEGFGGLVNLSGGSDAKVITPAGTTNDEFDVTQAYVHFASGPWMAIAGKYVTASGAEVIKSPANLNFSRSILFGYAIPFTHTGVRAYFTPGGSAVAPDGKPTFFFGVNNGWDVLKESQQAAASDGSIADGKTLELGVSANLSKSIALAAVYYGGDESAGSAVTGRRDLLDIVATFNATDNLSFVLNYDVAKQDKVFAGGGDAEWSGLAGYVNYKLNDKWRIAGRVEYFDDKNGFRTGVVQKWKEGTVTVAYSPTSRTELRGEVRYDTSNVNAFDRTGYGGTPKDNQYSYGVQGLYKF
jgi:hypothetical protein